MTEIITTIYGLRSARCDWCKRVDNPHPDFCEPIPVKRIRLSKKLCIHLCFSCFETESETEKSSANDSNFLDRIKMKSKILKLVNLNE